MDFQSDDPDFSVSWILGLSLCPRPEPNTKQRDKGHSQFESCDSSFFVSKLLGLPPPYVHSDSKRKPAGEQEKSKSRRVLRAEIRDAVRNSEVGWDVWGMRHLFGHLQPSDALGADSSSDDDDSSSDEDGKDDAPVLADPHFLELCEKLELLIDDIEEDEAKAKDVSDTESLDGLSPEDCEDESPSRIEWIRQKTIEKAENKHLDRLMSLPGHEETKDFFLHAKAKIQAASRRETDLRNANFDVVFMGNDGTGKTTMARLYARFLASMGLVKKTQSYSGIETFSAYNFSKTRTLDTMRNVCVSCGGCIAIIDHAHHLDHDECNLWNLLARSHKLPGNVVFIIAGDADAGLSSQLAYTAEPENHFPVIKLPNYSKDEVKDLFHAQFRVAFKEKMEIEGGFDGLYVDILARRLLRNTAEKNFGNAWAVKKAFREACKRQVERFRQARRDGEYLEDYSMTKEDLLGPRPSLGPEKSPAWKELQELVGLSKVKESILAVLSQVSQNYQREMRGDEPLPVSVNRVFLGSPGTGKTTVAKLYARILGDFGILSKNEVTFKNPTDLIDRYVGGSENNTKTALKEAKGGVLVIDDAHMLDPGSKGASNSKNGDFRGAILDTIVAEVSGEPGEDRCVILCGYEEQMKEMYLNCNPGLSRRFPLESAFVFEDFDMETLGKLLDLKLSKQKLKVTDKARSVAIDMLERAAMRPNFGNGGEVDNLVSKATLSRIQRLSTKEKSDEDEDALDESPIEPEDFDPEWDRHTRAVANTRALFQGFVGYEEIISKFESYQYTAQGMRLRGLDPRPYIPFTYVFKGPPGTGKTTTARKLGQIFYDMGLLAAPDVVEVSASQLIGEYQGQTCPKTIRLLDSALGKVLFIDEAYRLAGSGYAEEAVSELVDAVTKPRYTRKLVIVLAGYEEDMDRLMRVNHGMRSRFATELFFRPMRAEQCLEQLRKVVGRVGIEIQATTLMDVITRNTLMGALSRMAGDKTWASGRSVETLGERLIAHIFKQCALTGYTGKELIVTGRELVTIMGGLAASTPGMKKWGTPNGIGARQVMTLKDLEGYE